jgi:NADP-dependent 3-hydroxy acid dehydrogenase YdfG
MMTDYTDKVVAITGAANGMGRELAGRLGAAGAKLALGDIDQENLDACTSRLREQGAAVIQDCFDVADQAGMERFAEHAFDAYGQVDYVFSNAGVISVGAIWAEPLSDWDWLFGTNTMGAVHAIRAFIPRLIEQKVHSHFITTASIAGLLTVENSPAYVASKFASLSLTEVLELQLQDAGAPVTAHVVCPAIVKTDLMNCARHRVAGSFDPGDPYYRSEDFQRRAHGAADEMEAVGIPVEQAVSTILEEVEKGTFYILTHPQYNPAILGRVQGIVGGVRPTKVVR